MLSEKRPSDDKRKPPPDGVRLTEAPKFNWLKKAFGEGEASMPAQASGVGIAFAVSIVLGLALGYWLDKKFGTAPWLLLGGLLLGIVAGFKNLFTVSGRIDRASRKAEEAQKKARYGRYYKGNDEPK